ncbi:MAG: CHASE3 domain-containing protein [Ignavibacteria bacterium]|nr:CHASE3 domain-containing protein [Ignavibacteria bacterium]
MSKSKIINIAFACAIVIVIIISIAAYTSLASSRRNAELVKETFVTINLLGKIERSIINAETGQRGFIISGNYAYLEPYYGSKKEINFLLDEYKTLEAGHPANLLYFKSLDSLINLKFDEMNYVINLMETEQKDSAAIRINSDNGKIYMDSIRSKFKAILTREDSELKKAEDDTLMSSERAVVSYSFGIFASFSMIIFVFISLQKEVRLTKMLKQEAEASRQFFSTALFSIGDAVISTDSSGKIAFMNKAAEHLTKWKFSEAERMPVENVFSIFTEDTGAPVESPVQEAIETKKIAGLKNHTLLIDKEKNSINIDDCAAPILNDKDEVTGAVLIFRDISGKRQIERELNKSYEKVKELNKEMETKIRELEVLNRDLEAFSYSVSHDLRAPLRAIDGFAKILQEEYEIKLDDEGRRYLKIVRENAANMGALINALLDFARMGRKSLNCEIVDFGKIIDDCIRMYKDEIKAENVFTVKPLLPAYADGMLIAEVWKNLIGNAIKFSSKNENPKIEIGCEVNNSDVTYYVKDNGAGFNEKSAGRLFGVFQRLHTDSEFPGFGIGLALCSKIVRLHGGTIRGESKPDVETKFSFTIPGKS